MPHVNFPGDPDDRLIDELRDLFGRTDPVPTHVTAAAKAALELRDLDTQIAELLRDSAVEERELAGVRGTAARLLTFAVGEDRFIEIDVAVEADGRTLTGYVVPGAAGSLTVEHPERVIHGPLDEHGRFSISGVPAGPIRLRIACPGSPTVVTEWLPI